MKVEPFHSAPVKPIFRPIITRLTLPQPQNLKFMSIEHCAHCRLISRLTSPMIKIELPIPRPATPFITFQRHRPLHIYLREARAKLLEDFLHPIQVTLFFSTPFRFFGERTGAVRCRDEGCGFAMILTKKNTNYSTRQTQQGTAKTMRMEIHGPSRLYICEPSHIRVHQD
jgi:hypothetical protein